MFGQLGVTDDALARSSSIRRPLLRFCRDWSEQRHHLGGKLGATILTTLEHAEWITRRPGDRAVTLTDLGRLRLTDRLGLPLQ